MARKYDPDQFYAQSGFVVRYTEEKRIQAIVNLVGAEPGDRILEVGCGAGHILNRIGAGELHGVDLSDFMLQKAQARLAGRVKLRKANAENLPFEPGSFGKVICSEVLEHVPEPRKVLAEIARVLAPGGIAVVSVPNEPLINGLKSLLIKLGIYNVLLKRPKGYTPPPRMDDEWHLHTFSLRMLLDVSEGLFVAARTKRVPFAFVPLRYVVQFARAA